VGVAECETPPESANRPADSWKDLRRHTCFAAEGGVYAYRQMAR